MKTTYALLLALGFTAALAIHPVTAQAAGSGSDVFADEGDSDFDSIPTDISKVPSAPAMKVPAAAAKDTEDSSPIASPGEQRAETEDAPAPAIEHRTPRNRNVKKEVEPTTDAVATDDSAPTEKPKRSATAVGANGFRVVGHDCPMYREPASEGEPMLTVKSEKRIWVEQKGEWAKAYSKSGPGYISTDCLK